MWTENNDSIKSFQSHDTHIVNFFDWITRVRRINSSFLCAFTRAIRLCAHSTARRLPYSHQIAVDFRSTSASAVHPTQLHTYTRSTSILHDISPTQVISSVVKKAARSPHRNICTYLVFGAWDTLEPINDMAKDLPIMFWSSRNQITIGIIYAQTNFGFDALSAFFLSWNRRFFLFFPYSHSIVRKHFYNGILLFGNSFYCSVFHLMSVHCVCIGSTFVRTK